MIIIQQLNKYNQMKKVGVFLLIYNLFVVVSFAQDGDLIRGASYFTKTIEYNLARGWYGRAGNGYNLNSKNGIEKKLFRDFNAPVEFFYHHPTYDMLPGEKKEVVCSAFRIMRDSLDKNYVLQVKRLFKEVDSISFFISDRFADKMHKKMSSLIHNFKARDTLSIIFDGYKIMEQELQFITGAVLRINFCTVVDDEVWSLRIYEPNGSALKMSNICKRIITDAETKNFEEATYSKLLDDYDF